MVSRRALLEKDRAGGNIVSDICWGTHVCQLYHTKQDLIDVLVPYFKAGLENNELCMWITSEPLKVHEATAALSEAVEDLDNYIKKDHIKILDQRDWYTRAGKFDAGAVLQSWLKKESLALGKGFNGLRVCAHTFDLHRLEWHNLISYESVADSIIRRHKIIAICAYSLDQCAVPELVDIVSNHRFILLRREAKWELIDNTGHKWLNELRRSGSSYAEIGRKLRLTRERVRQIVMGRAVSNKKVSPDDQMLTISKASKLLNLHMNTLRRWSDQGMLPCYRMGTRGDRRYRRGDLIDFRRKRAWHSMSVSTPQEQLGR
jgi:excisionase family DNA binding protein